MAIGKSPKHAGNQAETSSKGKSNRKNVNGYFSPKKVVKINSPDTSRTGKPTQSPKKKHQVPESDSITGTSKSKPTKSPDSQRSKARTPVSSSPRYKKKENSTKATKQLRVEKIENLIEENEVSNAQSDPPYFTQKELARPVCAKGAELETPEGMIVTEEVMYGDFGVISCRFSTSPSIEKFSLKYEKRTMRFRRLKTELSVLIQAQASENSRFFPHIYARSQLFDTHHFFVCDLLGRNLTVQRILCGGRFNLQTIFRLAFLTLNCIATLHELGFIHRDIKPNVFTVSVYPNTNRILLSSVGLCREVINKKSRTYVPFLGSVCYSSRCNHRHKEQVYIDDLESWLYMLCEWIDPAIITWSNDDDKTSVLKAKEEFMTSDKGFHDALTKCLDLPPEFVDIVDYINSLGGEMIIPQKRFILDVLKKALKRLKLTEDAPFQWFKE